MNNTAQASELYKLFKSVALSEILFISLTKGISKLPNFGVVISAAEGTVISNFTVAFTHSSVSHSIPFIVILSPLLLSFLKNSNAFFIFDNNSSYGSN